MNAKAAKTIQQHHLSMTTAFESITKTDSLLTYLSENLLLTKPLLLQHFLSSWSPAQWSLESLQHGSKGGLLYRQLSEFKKAYNFAGLKPCDSQGFSHKL